jgi:hypothetical protein
MGRMKGWGNGKAVGDGGVNIIEVYHIYVCK